VASTADSFAGPWFRTDDDDDDDDNDDGEHSPSADKSKPPPGKPKPQPGRKGKEPEQSAQAPTGSGAQAWGGAIHHGLRSTERGAAAAGGWAEAAVGRSPPASPSPRGPPGRSGRCRSPRVRQAKALVGSQVWKDLSKGEKYSVAALVQSYLGSAGTMGRVY